MAQPKTLVTGATVKTGSAVVDQLLVKGYPVRASVRVEDARSETLARRGAEVVVADIFDPDQLRDAMLGVQRAYYLPPLHPYAIQRDCRPTGSAWSFFCTNYGVRVSRRGC